VHSNFSQPCGSYGLERYMEIGLYIYMIVRSLLYMAARLSCLCPVPG
jgi:hypothetical protein